MKIKRICNYYFIFLIISTYNCIFTQTQDYFATEFGKSRGEYNYKINFTGYKESGEKGFRYFYFSNQDYYRYQFEETPLSDHFEHEPRKSIIIDKWEADFIISFETDEDIEYDNSWDATGVLKDVYTPFTEIRRIIFNLKLFDSSGLLKNVPVALMLSAPLGLNNIYIGQEFSALIPPLQAELKVVDYLVGTDDFDRPCFKYINFDLKISRVDNYPRIDLLKKQND
jgi:hypothetical protein